jgi:hypothetical protein
MINVVIDHLMTQLSEFLPIRWIKRQISISLNKERRALICHERI